MENRRGEGLSDGSIELARGDARARVSTFGAEAVAWRIGERNLLWSASAGYWDRVAPVLFPCVGWSRNGLIRIDGRTYAMPVHGFAPSSRFELIARTPDSAAFELRDNAATRAHYPFSFLLRVRYALAPRALRVDLAVTNTGGEIMPYSCGLHPGFAWPFAGGAQTDYEIRFSDEEAPETPVIAAGGLFSSRTRAVPLQGRNLRLAPSLFEREAACFLHARSRDVWFVGPGGALHAQAEGFRHWALWSQPGAPFLCVEAWTGHGDPEDFEGEFRDKRSIDLLGAGETGRHALTFRYVDAPDADDPWNQRRGLRKDGLRRRA